MKRPLIALRWCTPELLLPPVSTTLVRGRRAAAALEMYRPVIALRFAMRAPFLSSHQLTTSYLNTEHATPLNLTKGDVARCFLI